MPRSPSVVAISRGVRRACVKAKVATRPSIVGSPCSVYASGRPPRKRSASALVRTGEAAEDPLAARPLVRLDRVPADGFHVLDGRDEAGEKLVRERARRE